MVIISTSATEVSIQAVSPEFGVHFSVTAFFGSVSLTQAGGAAAAGGAAVGGAAAAGAAGAGCAEAVSNAVMLRQRPSRTPKARANSPARENFFNVMAYSCPCCLRCGRLKRRRVGLAGADADGVIEAEHENLAVADLSGFGGAGDRADDLVDLVGGHRDFHLELGKEAHRVFGATVDFRATLLTPVSFDLGDGQPLHADGGQRVADLVELERLDDGHDDLHGFDPRLGPFVTFTQCGRVH